MNWLWRKKIEDVEQAVVQSPTQSTHSEKTVVAESRPSTAMDTKSQCKVAVLRFIKTLIGVRLRKN